MIRRGLFIFILIGEVVYANVKYTSCNSTMKSDGKCYDLQGKLCNGSFQIQWETKGFPIWIEVGKFKDGLRDGWISRFNHKGVHKSAYVMKKGEIDYPQIKYHFDGQYFYKDYQERPKKSTHYTYYSYPTKYNGKPLYADAFEKALSKLTKQVKFFENHQLVEEWNYYKGSILKNRIKKTKIENSGPYNPYSGYSTKKEIFVVNSMGFFRNEQLQYKRSYIEDGTSKKPYGVFVSYNPFGELVEEEFYNYKYQKEGYPRKRVKYNQGKVKWVEDNELQRTVHYFDYTKKQIHSIHNDKGVRYFYTTGELWKEKNETTSITYTKSGQIIQKVENNKLELYTKDGDRYTAQSDYYHTLVNNKSYVHSIKPTTLKDMIDADEIKVYKADFIIFNKHIRGNHWLDIVYKDKIFFYQKKPLEGTLKVQRLTTTFTKGKITSITFTNRSGEKVELIKPKGEKQVLMGDKDENVRNLIDSKKLSILKKSKIIILQNGKDLVYFDANTNKFYFQDKLITGVFVDTKPEKYDNKMYQFHHGELVEIQEYSFTGYLLRQTFFKKRKITKEITFYKNGNIEQEETHNDKVSKYLNYRENGTLISTMNYLNDLPHGSHIEYYENGTISLEKKYENGLLLYEKEYYGSTMDETQYKKVGDTNKKIWHKSTNLETGKVDYIEY